MWPLCPSASILWLLLPLAIGVLTGWWAWHGRGSIFVAPAIPATVGRPTAPAPAAPEPVAVEAVTPDGDGIPEAAGGAYDLPPLGIATFDDDAGDVPADEAAAIEEPVLAVASEPEVMPEPVVDPEPDWPLPPVSDGEDDLTRLRGVDPAIAAALRDLGVASYAQIAGWTLEEKAAIAARLGDAGAAIDRAAWQEQARLLAAGDRRGFVARFG